MPGSPGFVAVFFVYANQEVVDLTVGHAACGGAQRSLALPGGAGTIALFQKQAGELETRIAGSWIEFHGAFDERPALLEAVQQEKQAGANQKRIRPRYQAETNGIQDCYSSGKAEEAEPGCPRLAVNL